MPMRPPTHSQLQRKANPAAYRRVGNESRVDFYGSRRWRSFRVRKLANSPLCEDCLAAGRTTVAREIHHLVKLADDPHFVYATEYEWTTSLCKPCHSTRTSRGE